MRKLQWVGVEEVDEEVEEIDEEEAEDSEESEEEVLLELGNDDADELDEEIEETEESDDSEDEELEERDDEEELLELAAVDELEDDAGGTPRLPGVPRFNAGSSNPKVITALLQFAALSPVSHRSIRSMLALNGGVVTFWPAIGFPTPSSAVSTTFPRESRMRKSSFVFGKVIAEPTTKSGSASSLESAALNRLITNTSPGWISVPMGNSRIVTSFPDEFTDVTLYAERSVTVSTPAISSHSSCVLKSLPIHITSLITGAANAFGADMSAKNVQPPIKSRAIRMVTSHQKN